MEPLYHPTELEQQAQAYWQEHKSFEVKEDASLEKFYCLSMLPYPSGELHMGHVRNYTIGDTIARYQRMLGKNVLQPIGWDAFGLPAENAALKHKSAPASWTKQNISDMNQQLHQLGLAIDWKREFATCDKTYYRWEQWLFVKLFKKGLAYQKESEVNWDPVDQTVLANEQVVNGRGWRSGAVVERRKINQWFLKITDYADELLEHLDKLTGWPEQVRTMQRNWIGRSEGLAITFDVKDHQPLEVFTTRPDTLMGATFLAISFNHPLAQELAAQNQAVAEFCRKCKQSKVAEAEMATMEKRGRATPFFAIHPISGKEIPIWIANFVLMEYGTGAIMSVPAHDQRDFEFAQKYGLPITPVIKTDADWDYAKTPNPTTGVLINSEQFDGLSSADAFTAIANFLAERGKGKLETHYRLRDWGVSRQRYWGAPIPIIHCEKCGAVPVPEENLPVELPPDLVLTDPGSPLVNMPEYYEVNCPSCGGIGKRDLDTFDTFMESSWYYARYCCVDQDKAMLDDRAKYWTPVDQYIGGIEHATMHLLYARFIHKVLRDEGLVNSDEPFTNLLTQGMVLKDGAKMSKSKGNTVSPKPLIEKYGADTARLFAIFAAPPEQSLDWSDSGVDGAFRFLRKVWQFHYEHHQKFKALNQADTKYNWGNAEEEILEQRKELHTLLKQAENDLQRLQLNTIVSAAMKMMNILAKLDAEDEAQMALIFEGSSILLRILNPITPHICHTLWRELDFGNDISRANWPKVDSKALKTTTVDLVVQINGKRRGNINVPIDADQDLITQLLLDDDKIAEHLGDKELRKVIVVPNRLVNVVV